jgi:biopolymer transport protein ExbD
MNSPGKNLNFSREEQSDHFVRLQMAPLIDIVFLLICFYLLVSQLIQHQKDPAVQLPAMAQRTTDVETPAEIVLNLRADDGVTVEGRTIPIDRLAEFLSAQRRGIADESRLRVVIRADRRQRFGLLAKVQHACRQAGIDRHILRARKERR